MATTLLLVLDQKQSLTAVGACLQLLWIPLSSSSFFFLSNLEFWLFRVKHRLEQDHPSGTMVEDQVVKQTTAREQDDPSEVMVGEQGYQVQVPAGARSPK